MEKEKQIDILLQTIDRYWNQAIQNENQRANFTNYILLIIGALQGYVIQRRFDRFSIVLAVIIIVLGIFGVLIVAKYYERFNHQASRVGRLMEKIKELEPNINLDELESIASLKHNAKFPLLSKIRLNKLWLVFYCFFILLGIFNLFLIIINWEKIQLNI